jgi:hypothetical protein
MVLLGADNTLRRVPLPRRVGPCAMQANMMMRRGMPGPMAAPRGY